MRVFLEMLGVWFKGRGRGPQDLAALGLLVLLIVSVGALDAGNVGVSVVRTVLVGILAVLTLAAFQHGGWFKK